MKILGISSYFHDSSACLLQHGKVNAYAEEERFNRCKHTFVYPKQAVHWVLSKAGLRLDDIDEVVFYVKPSGYLKTIFRIAMANFPYSMALGRAQAASMNPLLRLYRLFSLKSELCRYHDARGRFRLVCLDHYRTHQGSAFFASPFDEAAILTMDFAVDGVTEAIAYGKGLSITDLVKHHLPDAIAIVYTAVTHLLGFRWYDEYKVMGMAAYGKPRYLNKVEQLYRFNPETGEIRLDMCYFEFQKYGMMRLFSKRMIELFWPPRPAGAAFTQKDYDLAASIQLATNRYGLRLAGLAKRLTGSRNLCLAGGVAQNCLMNQAICESGIFENVFLQPLAGDVGSSMGGALFRYHYVHRHPRSYITDHLFLGPSFSAEAEHQAKIAGLYARPSEDWHVELANAIAKGLVVGLFDGQMEVGPRALGSRSILADPRRKDMKDILNSRVKHREHFRPFAPSVLAEEIETVFEPLPVCRSLEFMIVTMNVRPSWRERVPAITHQDGTARVQAVHREHAPNFYKVIQCFREITGVPLLINTSFNDNEPIVCSPRDAINCFKRTRIDILAMEGKLYYRKDNMHAVNSDALSVATDIPS